MSWHSFALEYAAWSGCGTVGTLMTMELGAVSHRSSVLAISLDSTLESFTLGHSCNINLIACCEDFCLDFIFYRILFCVLKTEFSYKSLVRNAGLVKVALLRLADQFVPLVNKPTCTAL